MLGPWAMANYCRAVTKSPRGTRRDAGVLMKLSLTGIAKLSRLKYSWQSSMKHLGLAGLAQLAVSIFWLKLSHLARWRSCRVILYRTLHLGSILKGGLSAVGVIVYGIVLMRCPRRTPWTELLTPVCSYPIDVFLLSFNFLCLLILQGIYLNVLNSQRN